MIKGFSKKFIFMAKPIIKMMLKKEINVVANGDTITKDREPFILISNHLNTWDTLIVMKNIDYDVKFVTTEMVFLDKSNKLGNHLIDEGINKKPGKVDIEATKKILEYIKKGYAIGIFPEEDKTFYGETISISEYSGLLIKKANIDVVLVKQSGGYLSQPRWADNFAKMGFVITNTETLITKKELKNLTPAIISKMIEKAIYNNEYEFQRDSMIKFDRDNRAEGIERVLYYCNSCYSTMTVFGKDNEIYCSKCGKIGHINEFEFIVGNEFDNLVDYNKYQYSFIEKVISSEFVFVTSLNKIDLDNYKSIMLGQYKVRYKDKALLFTDKDTTYTFELEKIKNPSNTMRDNFSFDYGKNTYNLSNLRHQFVLFEMCRFLKENSKK